MRNPRASMRGPRVFVGWIVTAALLIACKQKARAVEETGSSARPLVQDATAPDEWVLPREQQIRSMLEEPPVNTVAGDLEQLYAENEIAANEQYTERHVQVLGEVARIGSSDQAGVSAVLQFRTKRGAVVCLFVDDEISKLADLKAGQTVTIGGVNTGLDRKTGRVVITHCSVRWNGKR